MTSPFDEMTLGEVEEMIDLCLNGKPIQDADPMTLAGGVMFMARRRGEPELDWATFKATTRMADIKEFSTSLADDSLDPTNAETN